MSFLAICLRLSAFHHGRNAYRFDLRFRGFAKCCMALVPAVRASLKNAVFAFRYAKKAVSTQKTHNITD